MTDSFPFLSVIIPAYNEENRIEHTLASVLEHLRGQSFSSEIIIVDDGSRDQTAQAVQTKIAGMDNAHLIGYQPNRGKGYAIRQGVLAARGKYVLFTDADLSTPVSEIEPALGQLQTGFDIVIGSRAVAGSAISRYQPLYRRLGAKLFNVLRDGIVSANISRFKDTQCGFKAFRGRVAHDLFGRMDVNGFMFDVELIYVALKLGYRIYELPVRWTDATGSKVRMVSDTLRMFRDLVRIRFKYVNVARREQDQAGDQR